MRDDSLLNLVIFKIVQRCNLDCSYCYVYNRGDDSWRTRPPVVSDAVVNKLAARIDEHCARYTRKSFTVELHGGEPLLIGKRRMRRLLSLLWNGCTIVTPRIILQTNGTLLDEEWISIFSEYDISFGISLDAPVPAGSPAKRVWRHSRSDSTA